MRKPVLTVLLAAAAASGARAVFLGSDKTVASLWAERPLSMDGGQEQWAKSGETGEPSVVLRAMNDSADLYLLITPRGRHGRGLLSGGYRQDVALWFLGPDQKTRAWGLLIPFSRLLEELPPGATQPPAIEPEYVAMKDGQIATGPMPAGVASHLEFDERKPQIELRIALKILPAPVDKTVPAVPVELTTTPVPPVIAAQIRNEKTAAGAAGGGRHHGHHGGGPSGGGQNGSPPQNAAQANAPEQTPDEVPGAPEEAPTVPDALDLSLIVKLAGAPLPP